MGDRAGGGRASVVRSSAVHKCAGKERRSRTARETGRASRAYPTTVDGMMAEGRS